MRDWRAYVRVRLHLPGFLPEREAEAIDEVACQLEDVARSAMDGGASEDEAGAIAERHVADWAALGFRATHLVTFRVDLPDEDPAEREGVFYQELLERLRAMPGVRAAGAAYGVPFSGRDPYDDHGDRRTAGRGRCP
jgi:hypothetical protein